MDSTFKRNSGSSFSTTSQTRLRFTPKYSWIILSRMAAMSRQGTSLGLVAQGAWLHSDTASA